VAPVLVTYPAGIVAHCRHVHLRKSRRHPATRVHVDRPQGHPRLVRL